MTRRLFCLLAVLAVPVAIGGQSRSGLDPQRLYQPLGETWPTYSGDYTARRYSSLTQINQTNVKQLTLAWVAKMVPGVNPIPAFGSAGQNGGPVIMAPTSVGGEAKGDMGAGIPVNISGAIVTHDGVLYVTSPDNVWAVDARDGHIIWHSYWRTRGGTHIGNRGVALWHDYLFFETAEIGRAHV